MTVRPVDHEARMSLVEHLDELRSRVLRCLIILAVVFGVCAWQNQAILDIVGKPLDQETQKRTLKGQGPIGETYVAQRAARELAESDVTIYRALSADRTVSDELRQVAEQQADRAQQTLDRLPRTPPTTKPVTLGIGEPFTQTIVIAAYTSILIALPLLLYEVYAFLMPALSRAERRRITPFFCMVPILFYVGVVFAYLVVLPPATSFLQNFNADQFNVLVQARDYFKFAVLTLASVGIVFQLPVALLSAIRLGIVSRAKLASWRRYALVATAAAAMILPGTDPLSMLIEFAILYALFELSLVVALVVDRGAPSTSILDRWRQNWDGEHDWDAEPWDEEDERADRDEDSDRDGSISPAARPEDDVLYEDMLDADDLLDDPRYHA